MLPRPCRSDKPLMARRRGLFGAPETALADALQQLGRTILVPDLKTRTSATSPLGQGHHFDLLCRARSASEAGHDDLDTCSVLAGTGMSQPVAGRIKMYTRFVVFIGCPILWTLSGQGAKHIQFMGGGGFGL